MAPNQRFSQGLRRPLQLLQGWGPFGEMTACLLDQRWSWCAPLSFPYFCMPVNHGPWLQGWREEHRFLGWGAAGGCWAFRVGGHVTNEEVRRGIQAAIGEYDELLTLVRGRKLRWFGRVSGSSGLAGTILQGTVEGGRGRGRQRRGWGAVSKSGRGWALPARLGRLRAGRDGGDCCEFICGAPTTFQGYGIE